MSVAVNQYDLPRWSAALGVALTMHIGGIALMVHMPRASQRGNQEPAIAVDLAPPSSELGDSSVTPVPGTLTEAEAPEPRETVKPPEEFPPDPETTAKVQSVAINVAPAAAPVHPVEKRKRPTPKPVQRETRSTEAIDQDQGSRAPAAAPRAGRSGTALSSWQSVLAAHLDRHKRYPAAARDAGITGSILLVIAIDRSGNVLSATVGRSSGFAALDGEGTALAYRASPVPPPPSDIGGSRITLSVPVRFNIR